MCAMNKVLLLCLNFAVAFSALQACSTLDHSAACASVASSALVVKCLTVSIPPIQKCQLKDTSCLKASAQAAVPALAAGIPEVGTDSLDPLFVKKIDVDLAGLKLNLRDSNVIGLKNSIIDKLSINMAKKQIQLVYHSDLILKGNYKASGRLLILPITGDGQDVMKLKNCVLTMNMIFDIGKNAEGKEIIDLKSYKYEYDVKDGANFQLTNLFNGNKAASDTMHQFMNTSWKLLLQEFGSAVFDTPMEKVFKAIQIFLRSQPLETIANV